MDIKLKEYGKWILAFGLLICISDKGYCQLENDLIPIVRSDLNIPQGFVPIPDYSNFTDTILTYYSSDYQSHEFSI
jgi:hypothetical protein